MTGTLDVETHIKVLENLTIYSPMGAALIRKEDHQAVYEVPFGQLKRDPKFPIPVLKNFVALPAEMYFRRPPFKETPPYTGYPPFMSL